MRTFRSVLLVSLLALLVSTGRLLCQTGPEMDQPRRAAVAAGPKQENGGAVQPAKIDERSAAPTKAGSSPATDPGQDYRLSGSLRPLVPEVLQGSVTLSGTVYCCLQSGPLCPRTTPTTCTNMGGSYYLAYATCEYYCLP
jgi:hypothetical protein